MRKKENLIINRDQWEKLRDYKLNSIKKRFLEMREIQQYGY